jgi:hypothetical protein
MQRWLTTKEVGPNMITNDRRIMVPTEDSTALGNIKTANPPGGRNLQSMIIYGVYVRNKLRCMT